MMKFDNESDRSDNESDYSDDNKINITAEIVDEFFSCNTKVFNKKYKYRIETGDIVDFIVKNYSNYAQLYLKVATMELERYGDYTFTYDYVNGKIDHEIYISVLNMLISKNSSYLNDELQSLLSCYSNSHSNDKQSAYIFDYPISSYYDYFYKCLTRTDTMTNEFLQMIPHQASDLVIEFICGVFNDVKIDWDKLLKYMSMVRTGNFKKFYHHISQMYGYELTSDKIMKFMIDNKIQSDIAIWTVLFKIYGNIPKEQLIVDLCQQHTVEFTLDDINDNDDDYRYSGNVEDHE
jgi:hypothetical protein